MRMWCIAVALAVLLCPARCWAQLPDLDKAVVPIVYPLERVGRAPSGCERIRYSFFGNAFFVGCDGLLLTAAHVLEPFPKPDEITVLLHDEKNAEPGGDCWRMVRARLVTEDRDTDLAFLQVEPNALADMKVERFTLAESAPLRANFQGEPAVGTAVEIAVFKPARASSWTDGTARVETRRGQITQIDRKRVRVEAALIDVYLISAEVAQGDSGAPLYDPESGQVVGVVSGISGGPQQKASRNDPAHRGAAVPVVYIRPLLSQTGCVPEKR